MRKLQYLLLALIVGIGFFSVSVLMFVDGDSQQMPVQSDRPWPGTGTTRDPLPLPLPSPTATSGTFPTSETVPPDGLLGECPPGEESYCGSLADQMRDVRQAALRYDPPDQMVNHRDIIVEATIDTSILALVTEDLPHSAGAVPVRVTPRMGMKLEGDRFRISPPDLQSQALLLPPVATTTTWSWTVTPTRRGTHTLRLRTYIEFEVNGRVSSTEVTPPQVKNVAVRVNPIKDSAAAISWVWKTLGGLAATVVTIAAAIKVLRRSKDRSSTEGAPDRPAEPDVPAGIDLRENRLSEDAVRPSTGVEQVAARAGPGFPDNLGD